MASDAAKAAAAELAAAEGLPLGERCASKSWRVRAAAYDAAAAAGAEAYALMGKAVADSNAPAQERALAALVALLGAGGADAAAQLADCAPTLVAKAFGGRPKSSALAVEACVLMAGGGQVEGVLAALEKGYKHKVGKVVLAAVGAARQCVAAAGAAAPAPQAFATALPGLLQHKDGPVRAAAKELVGELAAGGKTGALRAALAKKLRDNVMAEVDALLSGGGAAAPAPAAAPAAAAAAGRPRTASGPRAATATTGAAARDPAPVAAPAASASQAEVDGSAYEAAEPVDILAALERRKFGDDALPLLEALEAKKWTVKRDALQAVKGACKDNPRIDGSGSNYFELCRLIKKLLGDSNVAIVVEASSTITALAGGMRAAFAQHARQLLPTMIDKLKEKNTGVGRALKEALAVVSLHVMPLVEVVDDANRGFGHKVPKVRMETANWICSAIGAAAPAEVAKALPDIAPKLVKMVSDADASAREAALMALAAAQRAVPLDKALQKHLDKLDAKQKQKFEKIKATAGGSVDAHADAGGSGRPAAPGASNAKPAGRPKTAPAKTPGKARPASAKAGSAAGAATEAGPAMSKEEALAKAEELVDDKTIAKLSSTDWKTRVEGVECVQRMVDALEGESLKAAADPIVHLLAYRVCSPSEKVFQITKAAIECIGALARREESGCSRGLAHVAVSVLAPRIADVKLKGVATAALDALCQAVGPDFVTLELAGACKTNKNVKVVAEMLSYVAQAVQDYGTGAFPHVSKVVALAKECLQMTAPAAKTGAKKLCRALYRWMGPSILSQLDGVKPATLGDVKADLAKAAHEPDSAPAKKARRGARKPKAPPKAAAGATAASSMADAPATPGAPQPEVDEGPRRDVSSQLGPIVSGLGSAHWKERQAALERLKGVIGDANGRVAAAGTNATFEALKPVLADSNKMLIIRALNLLGELVKAVGKDASKEGRSCIRATFKCLNDPKSAVRDAAVRCLDCWGDAVGITPLLASIAVGAARVASSGAVIPAEGRAASMGFAARRLLTAGAGNVRNNDVASALLKPTIGAIGDKNPSVRASGEALGAALAAVCDHKSLRAATGGDSALESALEKMLSKASGPGDGGKTPGRRPKTPGAKLRTPGRGGRTPRTGRTPKTGARPSALVPSGAFLLPSDGKAARALLLPSRAEWCLAPAVGQGHFEALRAEVEATGAVREDMLELMFSPKARERATAAAALAATATAGGLLTSEIVGVVDLLLRWVASELRDDGGAGSDSAAALSALSAITDAACEQNYTLNSVEAAVIMPALLEAGANDEAVAEGCEQAISSLCRIHPTSRVFGLLAEGAMSSPTAVGKARALASMSAIAKQMGKSSATFAFAALPALAPLLADQDAAVRGAVLAFWGRAYGLIGDDVWQYVGELSNQQEELLQDKLSWVKRQAEHEAAVAARSPLAAQRTTPAFATPLGLKAHPVSAEGAPSTPRRPASAAATAEDFGPDWERAMSLLQAQGSSQVVEGLKLATHTMEMAGRMDDVVLSATLAEDADLLVTRLAKALPSLLEDAASSHTSPPGRQTVALKPVKYLLNTLMNAFQLPCIALSVPEPSLRVLLAALLHALLDTNLTSLAEGVQVLKALNVLVLKVLENIERSDSFCALIALLQQHRGPGAASKRPSAPKAAESDTTAFADLVVRCLVKLTKALGATIEAVDVPRVLLAVHGYLMAFSVDELRKLASTNSRPLRMIKTLLHELVRVKGEAINDCLTLVPGGSSCNEPIVAQYIALNLASMHPGSATTAVPAPATAAVTPTSNARHSPTADAAMGGALSESSPNVARLPAGRAAAKASPAPTTAPSAAAVPASPAPAGLKSELANIFKKIGNKTTTSEGLEELYRFTLAHADVDITPHLRKTSAAFRQYIQQGLARAGERAKRAAAAGAASNAKRAAAADVVAMPSTAAAAKSAADAAAPESVAALAGGDVSTGAAKSTSAAEGYQARMEALRSGIASEQASAGTRTPGTTGARAADVDALRKRMRRCVVARLTFATVCKRPACDMAR